MNRIFENSLVFFCAVAHTLFGSVNLTSDPSLKSWVESANSPLTDFPIQNLPFGIFTNGGAPRMGAAIGAFVLDLKGCVEENLLDGLNPECIVALQKESLNNFMRLDKHQQLLFRQKISQLLRDNNPLLRNNSALIEKLLIPQSKIQLLMPVEIGDYTDFYASIHHASHVGSIMRPDNPLMPNYKHMPIGYHGRASSIVVSSTPLKWPSGPILGADGQPKWGECQMLDYELEMGALIGRGNSLGFPIEISHAKDHIFGLVLINDWSARDIQKWEYQPLGPFNGKNFATTISPWVVTSEALQPFEVLAPERSSTDPQLLGYLNSPNSRALNIVVEAYLSSEKMRENKMTPLLICRGNFGEMYWTFDQMVTHHTSSGCNLRTGDLLGSGTISGLTQDTLGCLLERVAFKLEPLQLPDGTSRRYLEGGDEIILRAYTQRENYPRIGFGECRGIMLKTTPP